MEDGAEKDLEGNFEVPVTTGKYIWAANPDSNRVAVVDASTLRIRILDAGFSPTHLAGLPPREEGEERAIVINTLSHDATLLRIDAAGEIESATVAVHAGANRLHISPRGSWAIAWTDARRVSGADITEGFQDLSLIDLRSTPPTSTRLAVGYRPTKIFVDEGETRAFAVTEPGISIIDLEGSSPSMVGLVDTNIAGLESARSQVDITPDGAFAVARQEGSDRLAILGLADSTRVEIPLSGPITDLDLSHDGSFAVATIRSPSLPSGDDDNGESGAPSGSEVVVLPIPEAALDASNIRAVTIANESVGSASLTDAGDFALLYTNATPSDRLTILSLGSLDYRTVSLKAPIQAVLPAPDSEHAVAVLAPPTGSTKAGAFALIPLGSTLPARIEATDAPVLGVAIAPPPSERAMVVVRGEGHGEHAAYLAKLPQLQVDRIRLASPPLSTGIAPLANIAFVAQEHPEGRMTFIQLDDGSARTLTGFELGARVVD